MGFRLLRDDPAFALDLLETGDRRALVADIAFAPDAGQPLPAFVRATEQISNGTDAVVVYPSGPTAAGNALIAAAFCWGGGDLVGVTSNVAGTVFQPVLYEGLADGPGFQHLAVWIALDVPAGNHSITLTGATGFGRYGYNTVSEFSGVAAVDALASGASSQGTIGASAEPVVIAADTPTNAVPHLAFAVLHAEHPGGGARAMSTDTPAGWSSAGRRTATSFNSHGYDTAYRAIEASGVVSAAFGSLNAGHRYQAGILTLRGVSLPGPSTATVPALVQSAAGVSSGGSTIVLTLPSPVQAGNALFVATSGYNENVNPVPTGIVSSPAAAWSAAGTGLVANLPEFGGREQVALWHALDVAAGSTTVTVSFTGAPSARAVVAEFSGIAATAALDRTAASGAYSAGAQPVSVGPAAATGTPNQLVLAIAGAATAGAGNGAVDYATPAGYARIARQGDGFSSTAFEFCWRVATSAGETPSASFGTAPVGNAASAALATFKAATGATSTTGAGIVAAPAPAGFGSGAVGATGSGGAAMPVAAGSGTSRSEASGSASVAVPVPTGSGGGTVLARISGAAAAPVAAAAGIGSALAAGSGAVQLSVPDAAGIATARSAGFGAAELPSPEVSGAAVARAAGSGSASMPAPIGEGAGQTRAAGSGAAALPVPQTSAAAVATSSGNGAAVAPIPAAYGSGQASAKGPGAGVLPVPLSSGAGTAAATGYGSADLPMPMGSGFSGTVQAATGSGTASLAVPAGLGSGILRATGQGQASLPAADGVGSGLTYVAGSGAAALPALAGTGTGSAAGAIVGTVRVQGRISLSRTVGATASVSLAAKGSAALSRTARAAISLEAP